VSGSVRITDPRGRGVGGTVRAYLQLTKPRIIELLLTTTLPAMVLAARGWPGWWLALTTLIGGTLSAAGANVINQVMDEDIDRVMRRTRGRPIPTDRVGRKVATAFGIVLGIAGFFWLFATTNLLAASLSTVGLLFYVFVYTMLLKRSTTQNIVIGGAAGAVPPLVGWAAVTGSLAVPAWILFAIVFFWTPSHFWALAMRYDEDYRAAGVPMLPGVVGVKMTVDHILLYSFVTVGVSLLLVPWVGWIYLAAVVVLGAWLVGGAIRLRSKPDMAMRYFTATNGYLAGVFLALAIDVLALGEFGVSDVIDQAVLIVASILVVGGLTAIVAREFGTHPERRLVGRVRNAVEVMLPLVGAAVLVIVVWGAVA
jgi:protoheme IX farnesyltransferase